MSDFNLVKELQEILKSKNKKIDKLVKENIKLKEIIDKLIEEKEEP